jgi:hypothetical protein
MILSLSKHVLLCKFLITNHFYTQLQILIKIKIKIKNTS